MDLERTMTVIASAAVALIVLGYAFTPAREGSLSAVAAEASVASVAARVADDEQPFNAIADLGELAAYQATLPITWVDRPTTRSAWPVEQIEDLAALAEYQLLLADHWGSHPLPAPSQLADPAQLTANQSTPAISHEGVADRP